MNGHRKLLLLLPLLLLVASCGEMFPGRKWRLLSEQSTASTLTVRIAVDRGSSEAEVRKYHRQVQKEYRSRAEGDLFIDFYEGHRSVESLIATDDGSGKLKWLR